MEEDERPLAQVIEEDGWSHDLAREVVNGELEATPEQFTAAYDFLAEE